MATSTPASTATKKALLSTAIKAKSALESALAAKRKTSSRSSGGGSSRGTGEIDLKANNARYAVKDRDGNITYYNSAKDAPGYNDEDVPKAPKLATPQTNIQDQSVAKQQADQYTIQPGDSLSVIAKQKGVNLQDLINSNPNIKNPDLIYPGDTLSIPNGGIAPQSKFDVGQTAAQQSGMPAPTSAGEARSAVSSFLPPPTPYSSVDTLLQQDPGFQGIIQTFQEYMNPKNQRESLVSEYSKMIKDSGIQNIDAELLDMKNIIDGSEDDIRTEITKAGGFATESQVQAMTNSRNKQLIKNYNTLLETRNQKEQYINTLIGLSAQDRQAADQRFDRMMNFGFQIQNMQNQMRQNAQNQFNRIADKVGFDGLAQMAQGDPYYTALIENVMGLGIGGLQPLARQAEQERATQQQQTNLDMENIRNQMANRDAQTAIDWAKLGLETKKFNADNTTSAISASTAGSQIDLLDKSLKNALNLAGASGPSGISKTLGDLFIGDTDFRRLQSQTNTIRTIVLSLATDPDIKKFFGPQMSNADVELMMAGGTTLNPEKQSPADLKNELNRLVDLKNRMKASLPKTTSSTTNTTRIGMQNMFLNRNYLQAPDGSGDQIIITN